VRSAMFCMVAAALAAGLSARPAPAARAEAPLSEEEAFKIATATNCCHSPLPVCRLVTQRSAGV